MAIVSGTAQTYQLKGIREALADTITNISPTVTPFMSNIGKGSVDNTFFEWQTDSLASASTSNAQIEGDDVPFSSITPTVRVGNWTQIARKSVIVSGTADRVKKAGRGAELMYQAVKQGKELKRDMEAGLLANQAGAAGATGTARVTAGPLSWIKSNTDKGASGVDPSYTTTPVGVRTDGTTRAFSESILKNVAVLGYNAGAEFKMIMVPPTVKQTVSTFSGIATRTLQQTGADVTSVIGAVDVYVSDFGKLQIVPNRFMRTGSVKEALFLDPAMLELEILRPFAIEDLAKTGDATKKFLVVEFGLKVLSEAGLGIAADLS